MHVFVLSSPHNETVIEAAVEAMFPDHNVWKVNES